MLTEFPPMIITEKIDNEKVPAHNHKVNHNSPGPPPVVFILSLTSVDYVRVCYQVGEVYVRRHGSDVSELNPKVTEKKK